MAIIGDVHGDARRLEKMLSQPQLAGRYVVFLGDVVNYGPDSRIVVDLVLAVIRQGKGTLLAANHEQYFLRFLRGGSLARFATVGGLATIRSYAGMQTIHDLAEVLARVPAAHQNLLEQAHLFVETESMLISHAGFNPAAPDSRSLSDMAMTSHPLIFKVPHPRVKVVCGHYVQKSHKPFMSANLVCIDTGCGSAGGPLTAYLVPEGEILQV